MSNKDILHRLIRAMDGYESTGVVQDMYDLTCELTEAIYGTEAVKLLQSYISEFDDSIDADIEITKYSIDIDMDEVIAQIQACGSQEPVTEDCSYLEYL